MDYPSYTKQQLLALDGANPDHKYFDHQGILREAG